ncbi:MAG TPA: TonB-dependent receptor [Ignavibacteriaceae bacterium]|nr:TonB-dependent receptor [Ignavibacteriaceae bacterium]
MKKILFLLILFSLSIFPQNINGVVFDKNNLQAISNANVYYENKNEGTQSDKNGHFQLSYKKDLGNIYVSFVGYKTFFFNPSQYLDSLITIYLEPEIIPSQTILVEGSIGKEGITPITFSKINKEDIEKDYSVQDFPQLLGSLPSTVFYSENGNGLGYNYLSIRGFDQRRISVSINGIPQNDPEDHNVYWLDFPDLIASTDFIQVQRGAGSGLFGYPAIGGSINIITSSNSNQKKFDLSAYYGSYNTQKYSASFSSGLIADKYSINVNLSRTTSDGYRDNSWTKFNSYFITATRYDEKLTTQVNFYGGPIEDGLAYTGLPKFAVKDKNLRKSNYSYWEADNSGYTYTLQRKNTEIENFSQPHFELLNEYKINDNFILNNGIFLVLGSGFFDYDGSWADTSYFRLTQANGFTNGGNLVDALIRAQVENKQFGIVSRLNYKYENGSFIVGGEFRKHSSQHWGNINYAANLPVEVTKDYQYYYYEGRKYIASAFINNTYFITKNLNLLTELQLAYHRYAIENEKYLNNEFSIDNLFLNPRIGINYAINNNSNVYLSLSRITKEPRLKNYYDAAESSGGEVPQFESTNGVYNFSNPLVKPETMNDAELGSTFKFLSTELSLNLFYMFFDHEIIKNGKLDRFGQPITGNVDNTIHQGVELSLLSKLPYNVSLFANLTYSRNFINQGRFYLDADNYIDLSKNRISGFPDLIFNFGVAYSANNLYASVKGKYTGAFYSDNYDAKLSEYLTRFPGFVGYSDNKNDAYVNVDFYISYQINILNALSASKVFLQVNNVFDNLYSAYAIGTEFFPAAERNFLFGIQLGL